MQEFQYWWLLAFPLFFTLGWLAARIDIRHVISESRNLPSSYFRGLNFLLNEQPDKAIEAFIEVANIDTDTAELHFALGGLFRRRGEVERAIRMHQNLVQRDDLPQAQKLAATFELGQDYLKAGLLDRAEEIFLSLKSTEYAGKAGKFLLEIYVAEKDWDKAIAVASELSRLANQPFYMEIAHFYCELAIVKNAQSDSDAAIGYLREALKIYRNCTRANILFGEFEAARGNHESALVHWKSIELQNPAHLALVADRMLASFKALGRYEEGINLLSSYLHQHPSLDLMQTVFRAVLEHSGPGAASQVVREELRRHPTLEGLNKLLEAQLLEAPRERRQDMQLVKNLIHQHATRLSVYRCANCGFKARKFYWQCPACGGWESFPPYRREEQEQVV